MDILWTPWRYSYITSADKSVRPGVPKKLDRWPGDLGCVFCNLMAAIDFSIQAGMPADEAEQAGGLVVRGKHCFISLNAYPYTSGHVMVMPYAHLDRLTCDRRDPCAAGAKGPLGLTPFKAARYKRSSLRDDDGTGSTGH